MAVQEQVEVDPLAQSLFVIRHGDRWDYHHPEWLEGATRPGDPPLSILGHQQARETGLFLDELFSSAGYTSDTITWLASPFLRTLQTSDVALNAFTKVDTTDIVIRPEYAIFEMDGHDGKLHEDLPELTERKCYFPRLEEKHESLFVPDLPEPRSEFLHRCNRATAALSRRYPYSPRTAIVLVTHAAACVGIPRAAANASLEDINPAGPCSIFRLTRTSDTETWDIDNCYKTNGLNGYMGHISNPGTTTYPWNNFGDKAVNRGYTGPADSQPIRRDEL